MAITNLVSPGVEVKEIDNTASLGAVTLGGGAIASEFSWGPCNEIITINNETELVNTFGKPNSSNKANFLAATSFLAYTGGLSVVRTIDSSAMNAAAAGAVNVLWENLTDYQQGGYTGGADTGSPFVARYPGAIANGIVVSIADSTSFAAWDYKSSFSAAPARSANNNTQQTLQVEAVTGGAGYEADDVLTLSDGSTITLAAGNLTSDAITVGTTFTVSGSPTQTVLGQILTSTAAPTATAQATFRVTQLSATNSQDDDCIHVIVIDGAGTVSGTIGEVLEKFSNVSIKSAAKNDYGQSNWIKDVIETEGKYIYFTGDWDAPDTQSSTNNTTLESWDTQQSTGFGGTNSIANLDSAAQLTFTFDGGVDGANSNGDTARGVGYDLFADQDTTDVGFIIAGESSVSVNNKVNSIASGRKDAFAFISPPTSPNSKNLLASGTTLADKADGIVSWASTAPKSSYTIADSGYKKMYNKYNDEYVAVPLNGDIAGISALSRINNDAWWSPAGEVRGQIRNLSGLYFNPGQAERDKLYPVGVNPVVSMPGRGTLLYGDKTTQLGTGAFTRINVRGLFIVLEKTISNFAKSLLFEFNDEFTRSTFRSLVGGYLENVQSRRGITDFQVICDETNNTGDVVDANEFVGDIFIKPSRSINFIRLNFVAVRSGVEFSELIG